MCTLNVLLAKDKNKDFLFPPEIVEYLIGAYTEDYVRNSDGCGTYNGVEITKSFDWVPLYATQAILEKSPVLMAHTRLATCAKRKAQSLQPFLFDEYGLICMHNGVFSFIDPNIVTETYSDSWHYFDKLTGALLLLDDEYKDDSVINLFAAAIREVDTELSGTSPHSCFVYDPAMEQAFYWKRGRTMFMAEEDDFVYMSSTKKDALDMNMKPVADEMLFMFHYNDEGLLTVTKEKVPYEDKRWNRGKYPATKRGDNYELPDVLRDWEKGKDFPSYLDTDSDKEDEEPWFKRAFPRRTEPDVSGKLEI